MPLSIHWRLTIGVAVALLVTLAVVFVTLRIALGQMMEADLGRDLTRDAGLVSAHVAILGSLDDREQLQEIVDSFSLGERGSAFMVVIRDTDGRILAATSGLAEGDFGLREDEVARVLEGATIKQTAELGDGDQVRLRTSRLTIGRDVVGIVQVAEDADFIGRALGRLQTVLLLVGLGGLVLAPLIGYWLARGTARPLQEVIRVAAEIEASDLSRRLGTREGPAEVRRLAETFDAMLERLEAAFQQQRDFVLDMSHELRTPLTVLRGNLDVMLLPEAGLDGETRASLERMSNEVERLIRLTENLLYLHHAEAGRDLGRRPVELDALCLEIYRQTKDLRTDVDFHLGNEDQVTVVGDRDLLKQMLLNLVDNSLKYTPAGGEVVLSLYREDARARLEVRDTGPGIEPEKVPLIFKRFYRGNSKVKGGAGIGLAITDWIVKAHGGEIQVASEPGKGSVFTVTLPLESSAQLEPSAT